MSIIQKNWQSRGPLAVLLLPVSLFYRGLLSLRRLAYRYGWKAALPVPLPVVVIGNLSVGGTGKTPLCAHLVERFKQAGWKPAIVSRGYGGPRHESAYLLTDSDTPSTAGDEPVMLRVQTGVPVCVCVNRAEAVRKLAESTDANIVFSDDGLQHLAMPRVAQILVVDGVRGFGNGWVMPSGPLRDSFGSLSNISFVAIQIPANQSQPSSTNAVEPVLHRSLHEGIVNERIAPYRAHRFSLVPTQAINIHSGERLQLSALKGQVVHAVAGIGHPQRFFDSLAGLGIKVVEHPKADHATFSAEDFEFGDELPILVTAKDAVKLKQLNTLPANIYRIDTDLHLSDALDVAIQQLQDSLKQSIL